MAIREFSHEKVDEIIKENKTVLIKDAADLKLEIQLGIEYRRKYLFFKYSHISVIRFGGVISRDVDKCLHFDHVSGDDHAGNSLQAIQDLSRRLDLELDYHPDNDYLALWNLSRAFVPTYIGPGNIKLNQQAIDEVVTQLISFCLHQLILEENDPD